MTRAAQSGDFLYESAGTEVVTVTGYIGLGGAVTIPDKINGLPVAAIGIEAFAGCTNLTSVLIANSVRSVGYGSFGGCTRLSSIEVDALNPTYSSLDGVLFNKHQTELILCPPGKAGTCTIPDSVTSIGSGAFRDCGGLTGVAIPNSVTSIGGSAFYGCSSLASVTIPNSVGSIGSWAFYDCTSLTSVVIGASVRSIGERAFTGCAGLGSIEVDAQNPTYSSLDGVLFNKDETELILCPPGKTGTCTVPDSTTSIRSGACDGCTGLSSIEVRALNPTYSSLDGLVFNKDQTELVLCPPGKAGCCTMPDSVTSIGSGAFSGCRGLTSIVLADSVIRIGDGAFYNCTGLTSVVIGKSVGSIGRSAFIGCTGLSSIEVDALSPNCSSVDGVVFNKDRTELILCPGGRTGGYIVPDGVATIRAEAFRWCPGLTSVNLPDSVTSIGWFAFGGCTNLTSVVIGRSVTSIGRWTFQFCTRLSAIEVNALNPTFSSVDGIVFNQNQTELILCPPGRTETCTIPDSVTSVGDSAFEGCTNLTGVVIGSGVRGFGEQSFTSCVNLSAIEVSDLNPNYSSVDGVVFNKNRTELILCPAGRTGGYTIPDGVIALGEGAFERCARLTSVVIPGSVASIGPETFAWCVRLTSVVIPDSVTRLGDGAFTGCAGLTSVVIGNSVRSIGERAFTGSGLSSIEVSPLNPTYSSLDGVLFNKSQTELFLYPPARSGSYTIPDGVTSIGSEAFTWCTGLTSVSIPNSVTSIGEWAFYHCTSLTSVVIGNSVRSIGEWAFYDCSSLSSVVIPDSVIRLGAGAFYGCTRVSSVVIGNSVRDIGYSAFGGCTRLSSVVIGNSVRSIGNSAFFGCTGLSSIEVNALNPAYSSLDGVVFNKDETMLILCPPGKSGSYTIPDGVIGIESEAFLGCTSLTNVSIPNSVTSIGLWAFRDCTRLSSVQVNAQNPTFSSLNGVVFDKNQTELILCPPGKGGSYTTPDGVISIGPMAFAWCSGLTSVVIADTVIGMSYGAFEGCDGLTHVVIGNGVMSIGRGAFGGCTRLSSVEVNAANPTYSGLDGVVFNKNQTELILYPPGKSDGYTIRDGVIAIETEAFYGCSDLTSVSIPASVRSIGEWAFYHCTSLTRVVIPDGVAGIGGSAFSGCTSLTSVVIGNTVGSIGEQVFTGCTSLSSVEVDPLNPTYSSLDGVLLSKAQTQIILCPPGKSGSYTIPDSVTDIESGAFYGCAALTSVAVPDSVTSIGSSALAGCTRLTGVVMGNGVRDIGYYAFGGCSRLSSVVIGSSVSSIDDSAFAGCTSLSSIEVNALNPTYSSADGVLFNKNQAHLILYPPGEGGNYTIPDSVTDIESRAFYGCTSLTSVVIGNSVRSIGDSAFGGCTALTNVVIGSSVHDIGYGAFGDCTRLSSVTIPHSVTFLPRGTFSYCTSLTEIYCEGGVPGSFGGVFDGADQVTLYYLPGTSGWEATFDGRPTALWARPEPVILDNGPDFGVQGNRFSFAISWATNAAVVVEGSTNLAQSVWTPVTTNNLTGGTSPFSDPDWEQHPARFYRVRVH